MQNLRHAFVFVVVVLLASAAAADNGPLANMTPYPDSFGPWTDPINRADVLGHLHDDLRRMDTIRGLHDFSVFLNKERQGFLQSNINLLRRSTQLEVQNEEAAKHILRLQGEAEDARIAHLVMLGLGLLAGAFLAWACLSWLFGFTLGDIAETLLYRWRVTRSRYALARQEPTPFAVSLPTQPLRLVQER